MKNSVSDLGKERERGEVLTLYVNYRVSLVCHYVS